MQADGQQYLEGPPDFIIKKKANRTSYSQQPFYQRKRGYTSGSQQPQSRGGQQASLTQIVKKETLYLGEHDLGDGPYAVEIICSTTDDLVISAQKMDGPESFIIEIEKFKVEGLLLEFEGDLSLLA